MRYPVYEQGRRIWQVSLYCSLQVHAGLHLLKACSSQPSPIHILWPINNLLKTIEVWSMYYIGALADGLLLLTVLAGKASALEMIETYS